MIRPGGQPLPLVGVTGNRVLAKGLHRGPASLDRRYIEGYFADYAERLAEVGAAAVYIPQSAPVAAIVERIDGLVLSGGPDVDPSRYGAEPAPQTSTVFPERDAVEFALLAEAGRQGVPVLAICRGLQVVNVSRGGSLHQHVPAHDGDADEDDAHGIICAPGSALYDLYGPAATVNTIHHQAVDRVGDGLAVTAHAPDGVIEGLEAVDASVLAVQWHPEKMSRREPVFTWLIDRARARLVSA